MIARPSRRQFVAGAAALAGLLAAGHALPTTATHRTATAPDPIEAAWHAAGFHIVYGDDLTGAHVYSFATVDRLTAIALLPAREETAAPACRAALLRALLADLEDHTAPYRHHACADRLRAALAALDA